MKKVLYINNDMVRILKATLHKGEIKVVKSLEYSLKPGSAINGVLINRNEILEILKENRKILDKAIVVINSSNIQIKKLDHPELNGKQLNNYLRKEFSIPDDGSLIYGSNSKKSGKQFRTLFMGVPKELLHSYYSIFKEAKIRLGRFEILQNGMAKFVKNRKSLADQTFVLNLIEGSNIISVLIENGEYILTDRNRLMAEPGTEEFLDELLQKLSSMIQFNKSQKSPYEITKSFYVGLPTDRLNVLREKGEARKIGLDIVGFIDGNLLDKIGLTHFCCFMGLMDKKDDLNLKKYYKRNINSKNKIPWGLITIGAALILSSATFSYIKINNMNTEVENIRLTTSISTSSKHKELATLIYKENRIMEIPIIINELKANNSSNSEQKVIDSNMLTKVMKEASTFVTITNLEGDVLKKTMTITGRGKDEFSGSKFIGNLNSTGLFDKLQYNGYTSNGSNEYTFSVVCTLK